MSGIAAAVTGSKLAGAVVGSAIIGGISSRNASKKAANAARETSDAQLAYLKEAEDRARNDINTLFPQATDARNRGYQQTMDFLSQATPVTIDAMQQGNMNAQNVISGSMPQIQNALMGGNMNYGFMAPQAVNYEQSLQDLLGGVPSIYDPSAQPEQTSSGQYGAGMPSANVGGVTPSYQAPEMNQQILNELGGFLSSQPPQQGGTSGFFGGGNAFGGAGMFNGGNMSMNSNAAGKAVYNPTMRFK